MIYAILYNPGHNRVYFESALKLAASEFSITAKSLSAKCNNPHNKSICGVSYLIFETNEVLSPDDCQIIANLSFTYSLFELAEIDGTTYLRPIKLPQNRFIDESISGMLKYTGKTNEIFTRMMINIGCCCQPNKDKIKLLDPLCGKGTTLFEGLIRGFDVYGIEIGEKVTQEACSFLKRYLETGKYKFNFKALKESGKNYKAKRHTFEIAKTKENFKNNNRKTAEFIWGSALYANCYYKKSYFDLIVADLPYGIKHGNVTNQSQSSLTRNPGELLRACLPVWADVLGERGVMVLSWNKNVLSREKMVELFEQNKLKIENNGVYTQFEHKVDNSITRDIVVVRK